MILNLEVLISAENQGNFEIVKFGEGHDIYDPKIQFDDYGPVGL